MNKLITHGLLALLASSAFAVDVGEDESNEQLEMRMFGGYVRKAGSAKGKVVVFNAQQRVPNTELLPALGKIVADIRPEIELKDTNEQPLPNPQPAIRSAGGNIGVVVVDDSRYPSLLIAPEEGWAIINVAALASDKPDAGKLAARTRKEILRGFALAGGCSFMARGPFVLRPSIRRASDLDFIKEECYGVEAINTLAYSLRYYGVTPWLVTTYENACSFGWASQPTNEYQKAIWDKVHAIPSKPIKIEYNEKRDKGK